jgi:7,8-dihydro-6-hydroxymethylpterin dimethyltransferase
LQFDGLTEPAHRQLRGQPLVDLKLKAIEALAKHRLPSTWVTSVAAGLNDDELGAIVTRALQTPSVRGVSFQPLAYFGRLPDAQINRTGRSTVSGIIRRLEAQMKQMVRREHLMPLPCDVERVAIGYFRKGPNGSFAPILTRQDVLAELGRIPNTLRFRPEDLVLPSSGTGCCGGVAGKILGCLPSSFLQTRSSADRARLVSENTFRLTVASFVDAYNFDLRSCQRECVHVITPDLRKIPFSAYNLYHRSRAATLAAAGCPPRTL